MQDRNSEIQRAIASSLNPLVGNRDYYPNKNSIHPTNSVPIKDYSGEPFQNSSHYNGDTQTKFSQALSSSSGHGAPNYQSLNKYLPESKRSDFRGVKPTFQSSVVVRGETASSQPHYTPTSYENFPASTGYSEVDASKSSIVKASRTQYRPSKIAYDQKRQEGVKGVNGALAVNDQQDPLSIKGIGITPSTRPPRPPSRRTETFRQEPKPRPKRATIRRTDPSSYLGSLEQQIEAEIVVNVPKVNFDSIAGLDQAKRLLQESVVLPLVIPEYFTGIREPWRGVLLFGPPGTGKTMLAKAVAANSGSVFFNVSAASLVSKWHGESEKLIATLFRLASEKSPSVIFFDEIDVLGCQRGSSNEHEASRRLKGQLLSCMDGLLSEGDNQILVLATTNRPWDLDDALRRRFEKRIYVALPDESTRSVMFEKNLAPTSHTSVIDSEELTSVFLTKCAQATEGYSGADIRVVCREAAMAPIRKVLSEIPTDQLCLKRGTAIDRLTTSKTHSEDVFAAIKTTRPSVRSNDLGKFQQWMDEFGSR